MLFIFVVLLEMSELATLKIDLSFLYFEVILTLTRPVHLRNLY